MLVGAIAGWSVMALTYFYASFFLLPGIALALAPEKKRPAAIYAAMILGIIGGLFAVVCAVMGDAARLKEVLAFWIWVLLFPGMGLLGGILVLAKPKVAGILMLISGIIGPFGFMALGIPDDFRHAVFGTIVGCLLIIAGAIGCTGKGKAGVTVAAVVGAIFLLIYIYIFIYL